MSRTPAPLKWLCEKRARVLGTLTRAEEQVLELNEPVVKLRARLARAENRVQVVLGRVDRLRGDLAGLDRVITVHTPSFEPTRIREVNAWQGRDGRRGAVRGTFKSALQDAPEQGLTTDELAAAVQLACGLEFEFPGSRARWMQNTFKPQVKRFVNEGLVERLHDPESSHLGRWRWKRQRLRTLAELRASSPSTQPTVAMQ